MAIPQEFQKMKSGLSLLQADVFLTYQFKCTGF
jgi:hypothetical protein